MQQKLLQRVNATQLRLSAEPSFPVRVFANESVPIERQAVDELLSVLDCQRTLRRLPAGQIEAVAITPDFHKGAGIPIGTVLQTRDVLFPHAIHRQRHQLRHAAPHHQHRRHRPRRPPSPMGARRLFFEGGRPIRMTAADREALLANGLSGLFAAAPPTHLACTKGP